MFTDIRTWSELSADEKTSLLCRPALRSNRHTKAQAAKIIAAVRDNGDAALYDFAARFEKCELSSLCVTREEFANAESSLRPAAISAIDAAITNVRRFHEAQLPDDISLTVSPGVTCSRRSHSIDAVGLYVPSGSAPLPSTAIMLGVPASVVGCPVRILCTPAGKDGRVNAATLVAAQRSGIERVFKIGGAQAIAAMAYGSETVPKVDRIFGPGNAWVTAAKSLVASDPDGASIDLPAGPSELLIIADGTANPIFVAADLLSQAEHGEDSQVLLITNSRELANATIREVETQLGRLARQNIARAALRSSHVVLTDDVASAIAISNRYAPEHLSLVVEHPRAVLDSVRNAGSVFLGNWAPEAVGDYCSGANHVLPTYGSAKSFSGLGVEQFLRQMTVQELSKDGLRSLAPNIIVLAELEGLDAHAESVRLRLEDMLELRQAQ
jgi:histidinol dehydrogenase